MYPLAKSKIYTQLNELGSFGLQKVFILNIKTVIGKRQESHKNHKLQNNLIIQINPKRLMVFKFECRS